MEVYFYNGLLGTLSLGSQTFNGVGEYEVLEETKAHFFWGFLTAVGVFTLVPTKEVEESVVEEAKEEEAKEEAN